MTFTANHKTSCLLLWKLGNTRRASYVHLMDFWPIHWTVKIHIKPKKMHVLEIIDFYWYHTSDGTNVVCNMIKHDMDTTGTILVSDKNMVILTDIPWDILCNGILCYTFVCFCLLQFYNLKTLSMVFQSYQTEIYIYNFIYVSGQTDRQFALQFFLGRWRDDINNSVYVWLSQLIFQLYKT